MNQTLQALLFILAMTFFSPAPSSATELRGRLMKDGNYSSLVYSENGEEKRYSILREEFAQFHGQEVWVEGRVGNTGDMFIVDEMLTPKRSFIRGQVGQGAILKGRLEYDGTAGLFFYPENQKAVAQIGGKIAYPVVISEKSPSFGFNRSVFKASLTGVISGDKFVLSDGPYALGVTQEKVLAKEGDVILVSGHLKVNPLRFQPMTPAPEGYIIPRNFADWEVHLEGETYIWNEEAGEFVAATLPRGDLYGTMQMADFFETPDPALQSASNGKKHTFLGVLKYSDFMAITDVKDFMAVPEFGVAIEPSLEKSRPRFKPTVVSRMEIPVELCERAASRPQLRSVPRAED